MIIQMDHYTAYEITQYAKGEAVKYTREAGVNGTTGEIEQAQLPDYDRKVKADKEWMQDRLKVKVLGLDSIMMDRTVLMCDMWNSW